jgi:hypothetical protein
MQQTDWSSCSFRRTIEKKYRMFDVVMLMVQHDVGELELTLTCGLGPESRQTRPVRQP